MYSVKMYDAAGNLDTVRDNLKSQGAATHRIRKFLASHPNGYGCVFKDGKHVKTIR